MRALVVLGRNGSRSVTSIQAISDQQNIPKRFLEQILGDLKSVGILESKRGIAGGYRLKLPADQITLAAVIRHIEGPLAPVRCASEHFYARCTCPDESTCAIRSVMKEVRDGIVAVLEQVTVAQLCERSRNLQQLKAAPLDFVI